MTQDFKKLIYQTLLYMLITFIICTLSYLYIDRFLVLSITQQQQSNALIQLAKTISLIFDPDNWFVIFAGLVFICIWQKIRKKINPSLLVWMFSLLLALITASLIKVIVARYRPELFLHEGLYGFHWFSHKRLFNSFPSGHTTLAFAGLLGLAYLIKNKKITIICIVVALMITMSRILSTQHYLSDVLVSVYIGIFSYLWAKVLALQFTQTKFNSAISRQRSF